MLGTVHAARPAATIRAKRYFPSASIGSRVLAVRCFDVKRKHPDENNDELIRSRKRNTRNEKLEAFTAAYKRSAGIRGIPRFGDLLPARWALPRFSTFGYSVKTMRFKAASVTFKSANVRVSSKRAADPCYPW